jgi:hypothetical protein
VNNVRFLEWNKALNIKYSACKIVAGEEAAETLLK